MTRTLIYVVSVAMAALLMRAPALADEKPDFWDISSNAAASSGVDPENAAILLAGALDHANKNDTDGNRRQLTQLELMLAHMFAGKFEIWKNKYSVQSLRFDASKFDQSLNGHLSAETASRKSRKERSYSLTYWSIALRTFPKLRSQSGRKSHRTISPDWPLPWRCKVCVCRTSVQGRKR